MHQHTQILGMSRAHGIKRTSIFKQYGESKMLNILAAILFSYKNKWSDENKRFKCDACVSLCAYIRGCMFGLRMLSIQWRIEPS